MIYGIRYTPLARQDMDSVWDGVYEASRDVDIADQYLVGIIAEIKSLKEFPRSGIPLNYRGLFTGFYSVNYKAYKVFYRVRENYIEVSRILLAKSDYIQLLFEKEDSHD